MREGESKGEDDHGRYLKIHLFQHNTNSMSILEKSKETTKTYSIYQEKKIKRKKNYQRKDQ